MFCLGGPRFHQLLYVFWVWKPALIGFFFFGSKFQTKMWADFLHFKNLFCLLLKGSLVPNSSLFDVTPNGYSLSSKKVAEIFPKSHYASPPLPTEGTRTSIFNQHYLTFLQKTHTTGLYLTYIVFFLNLGIKNLIFSKLFFVKTHRGSVFSLAFLS